MRSTIRTATRFNALASLPSTALRRLRTWWLMLQLAELDERDTQAANHVQAEEVYALQLRAQLTRWNESNAAKRLKLQNRLRSMGTGSQP